MLSLITCLFLLFVAGLYTSLVVFHPLVAAIVTGVIGLIALVYLLILSVSTSAGLRMMT